MAPTTEPAGRRGGLLASLLWLFVRFEGRIGRQIYWLANAMYVALAGLTVRPVIDPETGMATIPLGGPETLMLLLLFVSNISVAVKRLHDLGMSGLFALLMLVPLINIGFTIWIGLVPGKKGRNRFGERVDTPPG